MGRNILNVLGIRISELNNLTRPTNITNITNIIIIITKKRWFFYKWKWTEANLPTINIITIRIVKSLVVVIV